MERTLLKGPDDVGAGKPDRAAEPRAAAPPAETNGQIDAEAERDLENELSDLDPLKRQKVLKTYQEVHKLRTQNRILERNYIERAKAKAEIASMLAALSGELLALPRTFADTIDSLGHLAEQAREPVAELLYDRLEQLLTRLADQTDGFIDQEHS